MNLGEVDGFDQLNPPHLVRIRDSDSNGGFQIAAVPDSDQIGKNRHKAAIWHQ
jgi:hypothetical protein